MHIVKAPSGILAKLRTLEHWTEGGTSDKSCSGKALEARSQSLILTGV